jgi:hypothetical protein
VVQGFLKIKFFTAEHAENAEKVSRYLSRRGTPNRPGAGGTVYGPVFSAGEKLYILFQEMSKS